MKDTTVNIENKIKSKADSLGIRIQDPFLDYDRLRSGFVTYTQFERILNLMLRTTLNHDEVEQICQKYDSKQNSTVNYREFLRVINQKDIQTINSQSTQEGHNLEYILKGGPRREGPIESVQETLDKISIACHKNGIRIGDSLKDFDKLRSGVITKRQFETEITNIMQRAANLTSSEIQQLSEYYETLDGRCNYKQFVETIENAFNIPNLEKKPTAYVIRPATGLLSKSLNGNLSPDEEDIVVDCLKTISEQVRKYNLSLFPFFKDFDRSTANTRNISKLQFGRVLSTLGLMPTENEFRLLCAKFEDKSSGDVLYPIFCQAVEEDFVAARYDSSEYSSSDSSPEPPQSNSFAGETNVDFGELIDRIRLHVISNRVRIKEFFQDMDPLNSGVVSKSQFVRCLSSLGVSSLGKFNINKAQINALLNTFEDPNDPTKVNWKGFELEVEREKFIKSKPDVYSSECQTAIENLGNLVNQRRINCWGPFKDFDKLNHGHVNRKQFRQCLEYLSLKLSDNDISTLEAHFSDNQGFNYQKLLSIIQPAFNDPPKYSVFRDELAELNSKRHLDGSISGSFNDIQSILKSVKNEVVKRRVSIYEWLRDHDKLNSGRISVQTFRRAINLCNFDLNPREIDIIINHYRSIKDVDSVEYKEFCHEIETAFGESHLEKNPRVESTQIEVKTQVFNNGLSKEDEDSAREGLRKISQRVKAQRMQLFPRFKDFDRVNNGFVSQNQFQRVLRDLNLLSILRESEIKSLIKLFSARVGSRDDVNYSSFCDKVYEMAAFEYRLP